jgi:glucose dehydrogenase
MWGLTPIDQAMCRIRFKEARFPTLASPPSRSRDASAGAPQRQVPAVGEVVAGHREVEGRADTLELLYTAVREMPHDEIDKRLNMFFKHFTRPWRN